jgi:hypothetical protein
MPRATLRTHRRQRHVRGLVDFVVAGNRSPELRTVLISRLASRPFRLGLRRPLSKRSRLTFPRPSSFVQCGRQFLNRLRLLLNDACLLLDRPRQLLHQRLDLSNSSS